MTMNLNQCLSDLIRSWKYPSKSGRNPFIHFRKLTYELVAWKTQKELIQERKILKWEKILDYLYKKEKEKIPEIEASIIELLSKGLKYHEIKSQLIHNSSLLWK